MAKGKSTGVEALDRSPSHLLHRAVQAALDLYAEEFGAGGLTQRQYALLAAAADHDGATQTDLVGVTGIDRSTLADMTARLMAKGLLERERSETDGRANAVRLTATGREALAAAEPKMAAVDARLLKLISGKGRREQFLELLGALSAATRSGEKPAKGKKAPKLALVRDPEEAPAKAARRKKKAKKAA